MKFYVLQRDFFCDYNFSLYEIKAKNGERAWEKVEEQIASNNTQEWLLTEKGLEELKKTLKMK
jgi:hypothetical protein